MAEEINIEIIKHLSSEIVAQAEYLSTLRSRVALTVLVGPFVVFGSFLLATKGTPFSLQLSKWQVIAGSVAAAAYIALGGYGALLDGQITEQCDRWRCAMLKIVNNQSIGEADLVFPHWTLIAYMIGWVLVLIAFTSITVLLFLMLPPLPASPVLPAR